jgi:hypothetical protein
MVCVFVTWRVISKQNLLRQYRSVLDTRKHPVFEPIEIVSTIIRPLFTAIQQKTTLYCYAMANCQENRLLNYFIIDRQLFWGLWT